MGYQPYPVYGGTWKPNPPPRPTSVSNAVKLMYAGAALAIVSIILNIGHVGAVANGLTAWFGYSSGQAQFIARSYTAILVVQQLIATGLWLWMARANGAGRGWARIVATVLFVLCTVNGFRIVLPGIAHNRAFGPLLTDALNLLIGLAAIICLWQPDASKYFAYFRDR
ncbi:MAG: hypothetical protein ACLQFR_30135 [Streptosporangiaceae bacterium]